MGKSLAEMEADINKKLLSGPGQYFTRSHCAVSQKMEGLIKDSDKITVISPITNCGYFMHIVVLTYNWIKYDGAKEISTDAIINTRDLNPTNFFNLDAGSLIPPTDLKGPYSTELRCYAITKPHSDGTMVAIAHYFAVLTDGVNGILYNAYGSELTKNPGYSMRINLDNFKEFMTTCNNPESGNREDRKDGYNKYFLKNSIKYWDEEEKKWVHPGQKDEWIEFVSGEPDLRIYEIQNYQQTLQQKIEELVKLATTASQLSNPATPFPSAPIPLPTAERGTKREEIGPAADQPSSKKQARGGAKKPKQKRKSKRKKRSRRTRRRKRTKTRRRRKK
jgi:hypothetical protein